MMEHSEVNLCPAGSYAHWATYRRPSVGDDHKVAMLRHHAVEPGTQDAETQVTEDSHPFSSIRLHSSLFISVQIYSSPFSNVEAREARRLRYCSDSVRFEHLGLASYRI